MKRKFMKQTRNIGFLAIALIIMITGCDKTERYSVIKPPAVAHFVSSNPYVTYFVRDAATDSFVVQVGTSDVSSVDRTVTFNISSSSGAVSGTDYTVTSPSSGNTVVIKAGTAVSSIKLKGNFSSYSGGDRDTLVFTLAQPAVTVAKFSDTLNVILQAYCEVDINSFLGAYLNSVDTQDGTSYPAYEIDVTKVVTTGATSGYVMMSNVWGVGGPDIRVNLDWSDPANFSTSIPSQYLFTDPTYGPATIDAVSTGSFSSCDNSFTLSYSVNVAAGTYGNFITTVER